MKEEGLPSKRYLGLIIGGAREAGLDAGYIENLTKHPTYKATDDLIEKRKLLPARDTLPKISFTELKAMEYSNGRTHLAVLGYVISIPREKIMMTSHVGRDITNRQWRYLKNQATEGEGDDLGRPPYPDEATMD